MKFLLLGILVVTSVLVPVQGAVASEDHGHEGFHKHHVSVFAGNTTDYKGHNAFTVGVDYEYRFNKRWGLVGLFDYATGEIDATVIAAGVIFHALKNLRLQAAPGFDIHKDSEQFVVRFGILYDFHVGGWTLTPCMYVDVLELDENHIYGLGFGKGF
jgi:hypothetical protein